MDLILIAVSTVALLVVVGYGVNSLSQIKGMTVFPLLRVSGKRDPLETASRLSQKPDASVLVARVSLLLPRKEVRK